MPRRCTICFHPDHEKINYDLLAREKTYKVIAEEYGVSEYAIKRHVKNHLKPRIDIVDAERRKKDDQVIVKALDVLEMIIQRGPELMETATINQVLRAIELHQRYTGEDVGPNEVRIVWGKGVDGDGDSVEIDEEERVVLRDVEGNKYRREDTAEDGEDGHDIGYR